MKTLYRTLSLGLVASTLLAGGMAFADTASPIAPANPAVTTQQLPASPQSPQANADQNDQGGGWFEALWHHHKGHHGHHGQDDRGARGGNDDCGGQTGKPMDNKGAQGQPPGPGTVDPLNQQANPNDAGDAGHGGHGHHGVCDGTAPLQQGSAPDNGLFQKDSKPQAQVN